MLSSQLTDQALDDLVSRASTTEVDPDTLSDLVSELRELRARYELETRLRSNQAALVRLARSEAIGSGDLDAALRQITETAADILGVGRSSVWRYDADQTKITCLALYEAETGEYSSGVELAKADFPAYFAALREDRIIAAHDAHRDPRTSEFSDIYLTPLGINSLLDAPIRVGGRMIGVTCNEQVGPKRRWTSVEEGFATGLADFTALAIESHQREQTERELREMVEIAQQRLETIERQRLAIADLSAPIIDVWEGVLALPIVGLVDSHRSVELTERLLERVSSSGARAVIVDLTGVDVVDTMTANHLLQMVRAARLLGTSCVLSGISPQIAQTLVQLQVDLSMLTIVRNLEEGLKICIERRVEAKQ